MDVVPKSQPSVDEAQWEEKVKAYHLPRAEINKVSTTESIARRKLVSHIPGCDGVSREGGL